MARYAVRWRERDEQEFVGDTDDVLRELRAYAHSPVHWDAIKKSLKDLERAEIGAVVDLIDYVVQNIG